MYNLNEFPVDFAEEFESVGHSFNDFGRIVKVYTDTMQQKQMHEVKMVNWNNNKQSVPKYKYSGLLSDADSVIDLTRKINKKSKNVCKDYRDANVVSEALCFYIILYLSFFLGVSEYFDELKKHYNLIDKEQKAIKMLNKDACKVRNLIVNTTNKLKKIDKEQQTGYWYSVKLHDKIVVDFYRLFHKNIFNSGLHKYQYKNENIVMLDKLLHRQGLDVSDVRIHSANTSFFGIWYECINYVLSAKDWRDDMYMLYGVSMIDEIECFVREIRRKLGKDYICWPLIGCHYNLAYRFISDRTKYLNRYEKSLENEFNKVQKKLINSTQTISKISDYLGR